jgi:pimeloyl-ACP methyl ester carboxylesterase
MVFARLANRFVLCPSRQPITAPQKVRRVLACGGVEVEVWIERTSGVADAAPGAADELPDPEVFILKFNGTGGRAERATVHPLEVWDGLPGEVWSVNPPGYGGSSGRASLRSLAGVAKAAFDELLATAGSRPIIVTGNSLGTATALHIAAHYADVPNLAGVVLRNPLPLRELIRGKFGWRTLGLAHGVAGQIPSELDSIANAARAKAPCVIHSAGRDRIVPPKYQQLVVQAYAGPKQVVTVADADHVFVLSPDDEANYVQALTWLQTESGISRPQFQPQDAKPLA